ncbi:MAG: SsrA-binding protein SmpB [Synergistales bacterium]|nr:SsrA-binding protein SmpB [Synergistales bacterium]
MGQRLVAKNRKARHEYSILESFEAGLVLTGTEIKSIRDGRVNLKDGYARVVDNELWLRNIHISPYKEGTYYNHEPLRDRKLLVHREQIRRLIGKLQERGLTLIPLSLYVKQNKWAKVELGLAKGKTRHDKREDIASRDAKRQMDRAVKRRMKGEE